MLVRFSYHPYYIKVSPTGRWCYVNVVFQSGLNQSYLAVFDGHGGLYASIYASAHFHDNLVKHPDFDSDPANAIKATFRQTDDEFCNKADREVCDVVIWISEFV